MLFVVKSSRCIALASATTAACACRVACAYVSCLGTSVARFARCARRNGDATHSLAVCAPPSRACTRFNHLLVYQDENAIVIYTSDKATPFDVLARAASPGLFDSTAMCHFESVAVARRVAAMTELACPVCFVASDGSEPAVFRTPGELKTHVQAAHGGRVFCEVCLRYNHLHECIS